MVNHRLLVFMGVMACAVGVGRVMMQSGSVAAYASGSALNTAVSQSLQTGTSAQPTFYNVGVPQTAPIPTEALRLRIIANSDSVADQNLKLAVRDAIVTDVAKRLQGVKTSTEARAIVLRAVPELQALALSVVQQHGYHYSVHTEVGKVPFPTKIYGNRVYPAGNYEALRIVLGSGQGQNWWCVLFPPLCFVDIADGDAVPNTGGFPDLPPLETIQVSGPNGQMVPVAVRLATVDYGEELLHAAKTWFGHSGGNS